MRSELIKKNHDASGHSSKSYLKFFFIASYEWLNMNNGIKNYVITCMACAKSRGPWINTKHRHITTKSNNGIREVDLIGRITTKNKSKCLFVGIDRFTKWIETRVIPDKTVGTILKRISDLILDKHGTPVKVISVRGREFRNRKAELLAEEKGIQWVSLRLRATKQLAA